MPDLRRSDYFENNQSLLFMKQKTLILFKKQFSSDFITQTTEYKNSIILHYFL